MRPTAHRHLHVLASAAVLATSAILSASVPAALADDGAAPAPYVVAIDPGHGGTADDNNPGIQFDPGARATTGVLEKDLTLGTARKLRSLLENDRVKVVMTRDKDEFVSIPGREAIANQAHA